MEQFNSSGELELFEYVIVPTKSMQRSTDPKLPTRVLVAEDDPVTRLLLCSFLKKRGHEVFSAKDGEQAWSLYVSHRPSLVISDWRMPRLDGLGLCRRIREDNNDKYTIVLILTSTTDKEAMIQGFAAGADDFMTKPLDPVELEWRIYSGLRVMELQSTLSNRIQDLVETRSRLQQANEQMKEGLEAAANTQRALLPKAPPEVKYSHSAWSYQPSDHLGGDALNVFKLDDHLLGFFIVDICGHGLPSALLAVTLHRVLTPILDQPSLLTGNSSESPLHLFSDPGRVLTELNRRFPMSIEKGEYFTAVYGVLDTAVGEIRYAGAGHPHPILMSEDKKIAKLQTDGFPVGFDEEVVYETQAISVRPGDRLFVFSDGIAEAHSPSGEMFDMDRVMSHLRDSASEPLQDSLKVLADTVAKWEGEAGQEDDMSMIMIEFAGEYSERQEFESNEDKDLACQLDRR